MVGLARAKETKFSTYSFNFVIKAFKTQFSANRLHPTTQKSSIFLEKLTQPNKIKQFFFWLFKPLSPRENDRNALLALQLALLFLHCRNFSSYYWGLVFYIVSSFQKSRAITICSKSNAARGRGESIVFYENIRCFFFTSNFDPSIPIFLKSPWKPIITNFNLQKLDLCTQTSEGF